MAEALFSPELMQLTALMGRVMGAKTLYMEPGRLRENGYCENFNGKLPECE